MNQRTLLLSIVSALSLCGWGTVRVVKGITFGQDCGGYLKRAANANTVDLARGEMTRAVDYLERHGMTTGYTSVLWKTPSEDVGFWYDNLRAALEELKAIGPEASPLERSNVLMKLRETLMDGEDQLSAPIGISVYPSNIAFFWWGMLSLVVAISVVLAVVLSEEE